MVTLLIALFPLLGPAFQTDWPPSLHAQTAPTVVGYPLHSTPWEPGPPTVSADVEEPRTMVLLTGDSVRCVSGSKQVGRFLESLDDKPFPEAVTMILCDEANVQSKEGSPPHIECTGRVALRTAKFHARAGRLRCDGRRLLMEAGDSDVVMLWTKDSDGSEDDAPKLSARQVAVDMTRNSVTLNAAVHVMISSPATSSGSDPQDDAD